MQPLTIFSVGVFILLALSIFGWAWSRQRKAVSIENSQPNQDTKLLWLFLYIAAFCLLGFIAVVFGER